VRPQLQDVQQALSGHSYCSATRRASHVRCSPPGHLASGPSRCFWAISLLLGHLAASGGSCSVPHRALAPHAQLGLTLSSSRPALLTARYGVRSCALGPDGRSGKYGGTHGQDTGDDLCGGVERGTLEFRRSTRTRVGSSIHDRTRKEVTQGTGS